MRLTGLDSLILLSQPVPIYQWTRPVWTSLSSIVKLIPLPLRSIRLRLPHTPRRRYRYRPPHSYLNLCLTGVIRTITPRLPFPIRLSRINLIILIHPLLSYRLRLVGLRRRVTLVRLRWPRLWPRRLLLLPRLQRCSLSIKTLIHLRTTISRLGHWMILRTRGFGRYRKMVVIFLRPRLPLLISTTPPWWALDLSLRSRCGRVRRRWLLGLLSIPDRRAISSIQLLSAVTASLFFNAGIRSKRRGLMALRWLAVPSPISAAG